METYSLADKNETLKNLVNVNFPPTEGSEGNSNMNFMQKSFPNEGTLTRNVTSIQASKEREGKMDITSTKKDTKIISNVQKPNSLSEIIQSFQSPSQILLQHMKKLVVSDIEQYLASSTKPWNPHIRIPPTKSNHNPSYINTPTGLTIKQMVDAFNTKQSTEGYEKMVTASEEFYRDVLHLMNVELRSNADIDVKILVKLHIESYKPSLIMENKRVVGGYQDIYKSGYHKLPGKEILQHGLTRKKMLDDFHQTNPSRNVTENIFTPQLWPK